MPSFCFTDESNYTSRSKKRVCVCMFYEDGSKLKMSGLYEFYIASKLQEIKFSYIYVSDFNCYYNLIFSKKRENIQKNLRKVSNE